VLPTQQERESAKRAEKLLRVNLASCFPEYPSSQSLSRDLDGSGVMFLALAFQQKRWKNLYNRRVEIDTRRLPK